MRRLALLMAVMLLPGCGWDFFGLLGSGVPDGVLTGVVLYDGLPASGRRITLVGTSTSQLTDLNGRYTFKGVSGSRAAVQYGNTQAPSADAPVPNADQVSQVYPNEVAYWRTASQDMTSGGKEAPPFDVAYNGLLYPEEGVDLIVGSTAWLPLHWSVQAQAQRYRAHLWSENNTTALWNSDWTSDSYVYFSKAVSPGHYFWAVDIDGGSAGTGQTRHRLVDLGPADDTAAAS